MKYRNWASTSGFVCWLNRTPVSNSNAVWVTEVGADRYQKPGLEVPELDRRSEGISAHDVQLER
jgi:hypothetical protein